MEMNGCAARDEASWIARAISSLPVPDSPETRTVEEVFPIRSTRSSRARILRETPTTPFVDLSIRSRSATFSSARRLRSRARSTTCFISSTSKGFEM